MCHATHACTWACTHTARKCENGALVCLVVGLALNVADHGFRISVYNRTTSKTDEFVAANPETPGGGVGTSTLEEFVQSIKRPRKVIILVQAGGPTDAVIDGLTELLDPDDIIIDVLQVDFPAMLGCDLCDAGAHGPGSDDGDAIHWPVNSGVRFSRKAVTPSKWSLVRPAVSWANASASS